MLTDDMHYRVKDLKTYFDQEYQDVKSEAEELTPGWGASIWEQANYFNQVYSLINLFTNNEYCARR
jgi:hypothetical protein